MPQLPPGPATPAPAGSGDNNDLKRARAMRTDERPAAGGDNSFDIDAHGNVVPVNMNARGMMMTPDPTGYMFAAQHHIHTGMTPAEQTLSNAEAG